MTIQNQIAADVTGVFLRGSDGFDVQIGYYNEEAPGVERLIQAVIDDDVEGIFEEGSSTIDANRIVIEVAATAAAGRLVPKEMGRNGTAGDKVSRIPGFTNVTWYVHKILENGTTNGGGIHRLLICDKPLGML